ncbi:hypothetical protein [Sphingomonas kyeonggiensis]|uniref:Uncharacterized protein n=1 Tax=Sphingomonas kyeonggiensis TaxID=1268553 RepID=A0A7W6NUW7_9SPHN|nr:hypothetical protein [Sphingomonas kyeonggiensis]MBB4096802.1 hypothetical protein [Sphingomonas kyeonggiensis]
MIYDGHGFGCGAAVRPIPGQRPGPSGGLPRPDTPARAQSIGVRGALPGPALMICKIFLGILLLSLAIMLFDWLRSELVDPYVAAILVGTLAVTLINQVKIRRHRSR